MYVKMCLRADCKMGKTATITTDTLVLVVVVVVVYALARLVYYENRFGQRRLKNCGTRLGQNQSFSSGRTGDSERAADMNNTNA